MTAGRKQRRDARAAKPAVPRRPAPGVGFHRARLLLPAVVVLLAGAAWWGRVELGARASRRGPAAEDSIARLSPQVAFQRGAELAKLGRHLESLPFLRRAAEDASGANWQVHYGYSLELHNAAFEGRQRGSVGGRAERSSAERVAVVHESLRQGAIAESLAPTPRLRAFLADERGRTLLLWGFPVDALREYEHALAIDPTFDRAREDVQVCLMLEDPNATGPIPGYLGNARRTGAASPSPR